MAKKYLDEAGVLYFWGKLKDYFQQKLVSGTNIKTINNESILGSGNISISGGSSVEEVFWATYGTTTSAEVEAAYQAGKAVYVKSSVWTYRLVERLSATYHRFTAVDIDIVTPKVYYVTLNNDAWSSGIYSLLTSDFPDYVPKTGGTFTGVVTMDNEQPIKAKNNRAVSGGGGWAYTPYRFVDSTDTQMGAIGAYGTADELGYFYFGQNGYSGANLRIYPSGNISVAGHSSAIGTVKDAYLSAAKSAPNNTGTNLCSLSLEAGTWLVIAWARFPSNSSGLRVANITATSGAGDYQASQNATSGAVTNLFMQRIIVTTSTTTYYFNVVQTSGSAMTMPAGAAGGTNAMRAVRIA